MSGRVGVRIVRDWDFVPGEDDRENAKHAETPSERAEYLRWAAEAEAKHETGEWAAYGVVAVHECPDCQNAHEGTASLWAVEVEATTLVDVMVWDLAEMGDDYLREVAAEVMADEAQYLAKRDAMRAERAPAYLVPEYRDGAYRMPR
jgi:hypothetical protein